MIVKKETLKIRFKNFHVFTLLGIYMVFFYRYVVFFYFYFLNGPSAKILLLCFPEESKAYDIGMPLVCKNA